LTAPWGVKNQEKARKSLIFFMKAYFGLPSDWKVFRKRPRLRSATASRRDGNLRQGAGGA